MRLTLASLAAVVLLSVPSLSRADDTKEFLAPENWIGLMEYWKIDGTTITGKADPGLTFNTFLTSKQKYSDFELSFKVELKKGVGNSGVQIRSTVKDDKKFVVAGPQCDIGAGYWGSLYGELFGGMMKQSPSELVKTKVKADGVNLYSIVAKGKRVTITINDTVMVDEQFAKMPSDGIIGWQLHAGPPMEVVFSNIIFKNLAK